MDTASTMKMPQRKPRRKGVKVRCRKLKSVSNRSQVSFSQGSSLANYKHRNIALSRNNRDLAAALEDARYDLSTKEKHLKDLKETLNNIQLGRFKILELHSGLKKFVKSFDEALKFLNIDNTKWQASAPSRQSRWSFKNKMKNAIDPVAEASEPDSTILEQSVLESVSKTNHKTLTVNVLDILHKDSASPKTHTDQFKHAELTPDERMSDLIPEQKGIQNTLEEDKQEKSMVYPDTSSCSKNLNGDDGAMRKEKKDSGTPKLSLPYTVLPQVLTNLSMDDENIPDARITPLKRVTSPPKKVTNSKIPRIRDVVEKSKVHIRSPCNKKMFEGKVLHKHVDELEKNSRRKTVILKHPKVLVSASMPSNEFSMRKNADKNRKYNLSEADEIPCRRKTFVVKAAENSEEFHDVLVEESQEYVQKELHGKKNMTANKRETFVVFDAKDSSQNDHVILNQNYATCDLVIENAMQNKVIDKNSENIGNIRRKPELTFNNDVMCNNHENASKVIDKLIKIKKSEPNKISKYSTVLLNKVPVSKITPEANDKVTKPGSFKLDNEHLNVVNESSNRSTQVLENTEINRKVTQSKAQLNIIAKNINETELVINPSKSTPELNNLKNSEANIISGGNVRIGFKSSDENIQELGKNSEIHKCIEKPEQNVVIKNCEIILDKINITDMCVPVDSIFMTNKKVTKPRISKHKKSIKNCGNLGKYVESTDVDIQLLEGANKLPSVSTARSSFKNFLSFDSEDESISNIDLDDILKEISSVKPFPVRKVLSKAKPHKKFTFCSNKRKSVLNKRLSKSTENNNLLDDNKIRLQAEDNSFDSHVRDAEKLPDISKSKKSVSFVLSSENIVSTNNYQDRSPKVNSHISEKVLQMPAIREDNCEILMEMADFDKIAEKDSHTPDGQKSKCKENILPCSFDQHSDQNRNGPEQIENVGYPTMEDITQNKTGKIGRAKKPRKRKENTTVDEIALKKKSKKSSKTKGKENELAKQMVISGAANTSFNSNNSEMKEGTSKNVCEVKDKVEKESNTSFVVEAEIHAPPTSLQTETSLNNDKDTSRKLSVVLSDLFQDVDKDAVRNYCRRSFSLTSHLSENSFNIKSTVDNTPKNNTQLTSKKSKELEGPKVRRAQRAGSSVSYKEPKLNRKMRR